MDKKKTSKKKVWLFWLAPIAVVLTIFYLLWALAQPVHIDSSQGMELLRTADIERAVVNDGTQVVELELAKDYVTPKESLSPDKNVGKKVTFTYTRAQAMDVKDLVEKSKPAKGYDSVVPTSGWFESVLTMLVWIGMLFLFFWFLMRMQGGSNAFGFGKSKAKKFDSDAPKVTFADVAGEDEAVEELQEIREFLDQPAKFHAVGAKIPKGVLLYGPPGTGKTLLAKAVAGEADVPFYSMSGSEFVEMFVGVGASRVRDLFEQAKAHAPAIIFVDEIDAVGRHRGSGMGGGHDEREQTLNQLLVEMDGFDERANVILIAATNRPDVLDPALLRPGRFDRQIAVEAPDLKGREAILRVHAKGKPLTKSVDLAQVAKRTPGFTGADLANVLNEAALLTARSNADLIDNRALDEAIDRVIAGPQKRTRVMNPHDKLVTAYHEGGHALCAAALRHTDPVTKVTILPRGKALGYTMVMPTEDRYSKTRNQLLDELVYSMGGRVAEELVFTDPSTGASNDIEKATATARRMVTDFGMSSKVGTVKLGNDDTQPFMGAAMGQTRTYSEDVAAQVDEEVRRLMDDANRQAWQILSTNRHVLDRLAQVLMDKETVLEAEIKEIFHDVQKLPERPDWKGIEVAGLDPATFGNPIEIPEEESLQAGEENGL